MAKRLFIFVCFFLVDSTALYAQRNAELDTIRWRQLMDSGMYAEAILALELKMELGQESEHAGNWHLGQIYACTGDFDSAVLYFRESSSFTDLLFDRHWRWYYKATIAFC